MIINKTKNKVLARKFRYCKSDFSKIKGLMFTLKFPYALIFEMKKEENISLHMFFVFYPIDVLFLSSKKKIVEMKKNFLPFSLYFSKHKARYILELENGTLKRTKTSLGDIVRIEKI